MRILMVRTGGAMLSVTGLNRFYYVRDFTICVVNTAVCCLSFVNDFGKAMMVTCNYSHVAQSKK